MLVYVRLEMRLDCGQILFAQYSAKICYCVIYDLNYSL